MQAVEAVLSGQVESAFAVVRPPGHHAEPSDYMGFCFFNNVAVAAHAALKHPGIQRVLILDWDVRSMQSCGSLCCVDVPAGGPICCCCAHTMESKASLCHGANVQQTKS